MFYRLKCFTLATLVIALTFTVGAASTTPSPQTNQAQTTQQRKEEVLRLVKQGFEQFHKSQFREALETFQQALVIVRELGDRKGEEGTLYTIGQVYYNLEQYSKALDFYQQALAIAKQIDDKLGEGVALNRIGEAYRNLGNSTRAREFFQQALAIAKQRDDKVQLGTIFNNIGSVDQLQGKYPLALKSYQQALAIAKQFNNKAWLGTILNNIGSVYNNQGKYPLALESYQQALAIAKLIDDKALLGKTLNNIAAVYELQGKYPLASSFYQQALAIAKQIDSKALEGATLSNIGLVYNKLGQYALTLQMYQQALAIAKQIGDKAGEGVTLNNIAEVYDALGQYTLALKFYQQALAIRKQIGNKAAEPLTLNNIGEVYYNQGEYANAEKILIAALAIVKQIDDKAGEGVTLNNIGAVYRNQGQYVKALESYQQALAIRKQIGDNEGLGITLNNIGIVYQDEGQYALALESYQQALAMIKQIGNKAEEQLTLNNIGAVYYNQGEYANAEKILFAAIEISESLRPGLKDDQKISIFEQQDAAYRLLQQTLVAENKNDAALEIAERGRARAFVELLASKQSSNSNNHPPTIKQVKQIAKEQNATLVEYSIIYDLLKVEGKQEWHQSKLYIWVVKPTGDIAFKQVNLKSLNTSLADLVSNSRQALGVSSRGINVEPTGKPIQKENFQQLDQVLIEPIASLLPSNPKKHVIFIPNESLFLVPFAALQDKDGKYLIEKHTILTSPAIQVLELTHQQRQKVKGKDVLVMGNPTMPSVGIPPQQLPSLPSAEKEAHAIASLEHTTAITGSQATLAAFKQKLPTARIIHLATHGLLEGENKGIPTAIALAPTASDNGLLTPEQIVDLPINALLVVLSACDTGRGKITGDGVIGLSRSLITAGASSVIVSLWSVPDSPTSELMTEFYQNLHSDRDQAVALRSAMLNTMKKHPQPINWAAFTLIGEAK